MLDKEALGLRYQSLTDRRQSLVNVYGEVKVLAELGQHPARRPSDHPNCIPWSLDPFETRPGWYHDAGMDGMVLTANDTLISVHEA